MSPFRVILSIVMVRSLGCVLAFATRANLDSDHDSFPARPRCGRPGEKASRGVALRPAYGRPPRNAPPSPPTPRPGTPTEVVDALTLFTSKHGDATRSAERAALTLIELADASRITELIVLLEVY